MNNFTSPFVQKHGDVFSRPLNQPLTTDSAVWFDSRGGKFLMTTVKYVRRERFLISQLTSLKSSNPSDRSELLR